MREASRQRRERPARRHPGSLEALATLTYTFSSPKIVLGLLVPCGPKSQLLPAPSVAAGRVLHPPRANPAKGSGAVGDGDREAGGISRASYSSDRHRPGARTGRLSSRDPAGTAGRSCPAPPGAIPELEVSKASE